MTKEEFAEKWGKGQMRYAQEKKGQKLHLVYVLPDDDITQPVCGRKVSGYRMTINVPLGHSCKNCNRRLRSKSFDENKFIAEYFNTSKQ